MAPEPAADSGRRADGPFSRRLAPRPLPPFTATYPGAGDRCTVSTWHGWRASPTTPPLIRNLTAIQ
jgi:hypothetical protein